MQTAEVVALGALGGAGPDILRLIRGRHEGAPAWLSTGFFWVMFVVLIALGGAVAYFSAPTTWLAAIALGFTAPEVVSRLVGGGDADRNRDGQRSPWQRVRRWWAY